MLKRSTQQIFKQGSKTYYNSSLFFPKDVRKDVAKFYSFVRIADDYVDQVPADAQAFLDLKNAYLSNKSLPGESGLALKNIYEIEKKYNLKPDLIRSFLESMEMDLSQKDYNSIDDLLTYIYGSAEVIGLIMNRIVTQSSRGDEAAQLLGRAMQYINFIRDIKEDLELGRVYIPKEILLESGLTHLTVDTAKKYPAQFKAMIRQELNRYLDWQQQAEAGYKYLPRKPRIAIKTAADMYKWTANKIYKDPKIVFQEKVKPQKTLIYLRGLINTLF